MTTKFNLLIKMAVVTTMMKTVGNKKIDDGDNSVDDCDGDDNCNADNHNGFSKHRCWRVDRKKKNNLLCRNLNYLELNIIWLYAAQNANC